MGNEGGTRDEEREYVSPLPFSLLPYPFPPRNLPKCRLTSYKMHKKVKMERIVTCQVTFFAISEANSFTASLV